MPAAVSTGIGSQVQKPLVLVIVGGILLAPVLILIVMPVLIDLFSRRTRPAEQLADAPLSPLPHPEVNPVDKVSNAGRRR